MAKKDTVFVFLQSVRLMVTLVMSVLDENSSIVAIVVDVLLLIPVRGRFVILKVFHVDLLFKITLHLHFDNFKIVMKRNSKSAFSHIPLY